MQNNNKRICWLGLHTDEIHDKIRVDDCRGHQIGLIFVNRCTHCGRLKQHKVRVVEYQSV